MGLGILPLSWKNTKDLAGHTVNGIKSVKSRHHAERLTAECDWAQVRFHCPGAEAMPREGFQFQLHNLHLDYGTAHLAPECQGSLESNSVKTWEHLG